MSRLIYVDSDWLEDQGPVPIGCLSVDFVRGKESYAFEYDANWLSFGQATQLDPELQLFSGRQYPASTGSQRFGMFLDSAPDRWGRLLMQRREAQLARERNQPPKRLTDSDYLLGVHDEQRLGAVRLRLHSDRRGPYESADTFMSAPPWASLRDLEHASWALQSDDRLSDQETNELLRLLMAPGSSLGGARPKAGVVDEQDNLWIAKFPARDDDRDVGAWESVAMELAKRSGINVPAFRIERFGKRRHRTYLVQRFDRKRSGGMRKRIHFASAMTMLGCNDGDGALSGVSYLDIAQWIVQNQTVVESDLKELWRRIVFSILIHNADDHLRNHGFLLTPEGWRLSPAFDLNPDPAGIGLSLNISELDNSLSLDLARSVAAHFRLDANASHSVIQDIIQVVKKWHTVASELSIPRIERDRMEPAFSFTQ